MSVGEQHGAGAGSGSYPSFDRIVHRLAPLGGTDDGDLWLLAKTPADHVVEKVALASVAAVVVGVGHIAIFAHAGEVSLRQAASVAVLAAALGFMAPVWRNRAAAARLRQDLRFTLSGYLDLMVVVMALESPDDGLFVEAARALDGPGAPQLRAAVREAGVPPIEALGDLAAGWGLHDIAAVMTRLRHETEGSEVQQALAAKAASLQREILATIEVPSRRQLDGENLALGVMLGAFHLFLLYPMAARILGWA